MPVSATSAPALSVAPKAPEPREKLREAAKQFEAIFVRQMLAEARKSRPAGEDALFGGQAMDTFNQMQDERFAQIAAERGAFGLARSIEAQLGAVAGLGASVAAGASTGSARAGVVNRAGVANRVGVANRAGVANHAGVVDVRVGGK